MAEKTTFIKLDRNITNWRWYQNPNTFRVFIHCLISAAIKDHPYENIVIERGSFPTTYEKLGEELCLSIQQSRTAIDHLKSTGELTVTKYPKYQVITVQNYDKYQAGQQAKQQAINSQSTGELTGNQQAINIHKDKEESTKEEKENTRNIYIIKTKECKEYSSLKEKQEKEIPQDSESVLSKSVPSSPPLEVSKSSEDERQKILERARAALRARGIEGIL